MQTVIDFSVLEIKGLIVFVIKKIEEEVANVVG